MLPWIWATSSDGPGHEVLDEVAALEHGDLRGLGVDVDAHQVAPDGTALALAARGGPRGCRRRGRRRRWGARPGQASPTPGRGRDPGRGAGRRPGARSPPPPPATAAAATPATAAALALGRAVALSCATGRRPDAGAVPWARAWSRRSAGDAPPRRPGVGPARHPRSRRSWACPPVACRAARGCGRRRRRRPRRRRQRPHPRRQGGAAAVAAAARPAAAALGGCVSACRAVSPVPAVLATRAAVGARWRPAQRGGRAAPARGWCRRRCRRWGVRSSGSSLLMTHALPRAGPTSRRVRRGPRRGSARSGRRRPTSIGGFEALGRRPRSGSRARSSSAGRRLRGWVASSAHEHRTVRGEVEDRRSGVEGWPRRPCARR